ncbi:MAG: uroporphyrinogen decarboxylase family protein [Spirochaetota bacterium]
MTSKERMIAAMNNQEPDMVPVAPDMSNMIPCRLTGKPFWDIYLFQEIPLWKAYINAVKHFGFDGWLPAVPVEFDYEREWRLSRPQWAEAIVLRTPERIYTRMHATIDGKMQWSNTANVYYIDNPPTLNVSLEQIELTPAAPTDYEDVVRKTTYEGLSAFHEAKRLMGEDGVVGISAWLPGISVKESNVYEYYDDKISFIERCDKIRESQVKRTKAILEAKPDFLFLGQSGHMIMNPEPIFRDLSLNTLKDVTRLASEAGIPSQVHCCGPEYEFVKIAANESELSSINPLEIPPMGDCDLSAVKKEFGSQISLMGNIHTTDVMLRGSVDDVKRECRKAMDDAATGGGFILSTGDQCGRDTPDENIYAMIETARIHGTY